MNGVEERERGRRPPGLSSPPPPSHTRNCRVVFPTSPPRPTARAGEATRPTATPWRARGWCEPQARTHGASHLGRRGGRQCGAFCFVLFFYWGGPLADASGRPWPAPARPAAGGRLGRARPDTHTLYTHSRHTNTAGFHPHQPGHGEAAAGEGESVCVRAQKSVRPRPLPHLKRRTRPPRTLQRAARPQEAPARKPASQAISGWRDPCVAALAAAAAGGAGGETKAAETPALPPLAYSTFPPFFFITLVFFRT